MELHQLLETVSDEKSFLMFVEVLRKDRERDVAAEQKKPSSPYGATTHGWENTTIESFLGAAQAWAEDSNFGAAQNLDVGTPWRKFATFLYCGKIYE
jgi:hypothetical protein